jgi:hypothetical protein
MNTYRELSREISRGGRGKEKDIKGEEDEVSWMHNEDDINSPNTVWKWGENGEGEWKYNGV